ncbi:MAG: hypothetical protein PUK40_05410 [Actinomycetaceae bacterium]|nr:hypothetical protein [Arcanobacterium sp.]MDD7505367.1 hypothetical protein [Actinomycetaceae bacterium]MDY6142748.1 hypothetical protein [Arcanobacterium sp.]
MTKPIGTRLSEYDALDEGGRCEILAMAVDHLRENMASVKRLASVIDRHLVLCDVEPGDMEKVSALMGALSASREARLALSECGVMFVNLVGDGEPDAA